METQINSNELKSYCRDVAEILIKKNLNSESLNGNQVIGFSGLDQVDRFILKEVFKSWEVQMEQSKSPYFDFEHPEVNSAFKEFANKLSFHIRIPKSKLSEILEKAIEQTLVFFFFPDHYLSQSYGGSGNAAFQREKKYHVFYSSELDTLTGGLKAGKQVEDVLSGIEFGEEDQSGIVPLETIKELDLEKIFQVERSQIEKSEEQEFVEQEVAAEEPVFQEVVEEQQPASEPVQGKVFEKFEKETNLHEKFAGNNTKSEDDQEEGYDPMDLRNLGLNEKLYFSKSFFGGNKFQFEEFLQKILNSDSLHQAREKFNADDNIQLEGKEGMEARKRFFSALEKCF